MRVHQHRILGREDFTRMNLPREFWKTDRRLVPAEVAPIVERYVSRIDEMVADGAGLVLSGPAGAGKSGIAAMVAKEARAHTHTVFFVTISDLREFIRSRVAFEENATVLDRCKEVGLLVLDGLKEEDAKEQPLNAYAIESLIASRCSWKKPTIVTTRLNEDALQACMPGVAEVMRGSLFYLPVIGPNLREQGERSLETKILGPKRSK